MILKMRNGKENSNWTYIDNIKQLEISNRMKYDGKMSFNMGDGDILLVVEGKPCQYYIVECVRDNGFEFTIFVSGDIYLLNENGKTIDHFDPDAYTAQNLNEDSHTSKFFQKKQVEGAILAEKKRIQEKEEHEKLFAE